MFRYLLSVFPCQVFLWSNVIFGFQFVQSMRVGIIYVAPAKRRASSKSIFIWSGVDATGGSRRTGLRCICSSCQQTRLQQTRGIPQTMPTSDTDYNTNSKIKLSFLARSAVLENYDLANKYKEILIFDSQYTTCTWLNDITLSSSSSIALILSASDSKRR